MATHTLAPVIYFLFVTLLAAMGAIFGMATCLSAQAREAPDDPTNYFIGAGPCRDLWRGRCSKYKRGTWNTAFNRAVLFADMWIEIDASVLIQQQMPWRRFFFFFAPLNYSGMILLLLLLLFLLLLLCLQGMVVLQL